MNYDKLLTLLAVQNDPIALKNKLTIELQDTDMDATILLTTLPTLPDAITGLLALCEGSMESRLVIAFSIMDNDDDGFVSKRQMWRILRSILCVTHLLVERPQTVHDCQSIMQTVDTAAVQMVYDLHGNKSHVTSSEVQLWYLQQGYKTLDLELANLFDRIESPQKGQFKGNFDFDFDHLPQVHPDHPVEPINIIFKGVFQTGREFILTSQDSLHIRNIVLLSTIYSMDFLEVIHLLHCLKSTHGLIHRKSLCEFVYALMDIHIVGREEIAATIASLIFGDSSDESVLPFPVVAAGLSVLCSGSKSSKLNLGFQLFDGNNDGQLSEIEMQSFLSAYLHVLVYCSSHCVQGAHNLDWVEAICENAAVDIFKYKMSIDFTEFSEYYNTGGFKYLGWIELIDISKWTALERNSTENTQTSTEITLHPVENADIATKSSANEIEQWEDFSFALSLPGPEEELLVRFVTKRNAAAVYDMAYAARLTELRCEDVYLALLAVSEDELLHFDDFRLVMMDLMSAQGAGVEDVDEALSYLQVLFLAMDSINEGVVDLTTLICGLAILCSGSKSEKLAFCFMILDSSDNSHLTKRGLYTLLKALLWSIWTLSLCNDESIPDANVQDESVLVDAAVLSLAVDLLGDDTTASFDDLAMWYADRGFTLAPWIELFDLKKWKLLSS